MHSEEFDQGDDQPYASAAIKNNAENAVVLWNVPQIAQGYLKEWERLWGAEVTIVHGTGFERSLRYTLRYNHTPLISSTALVTKNTYLIPR